MPSGAGPRDEDKRLVRNDALTLTVWQIQVMIKNNGVGNNSSRKSLTHVTTQAQYSAQPSLCLPPLEMLYLMPKSPLGPPGLWLAVRIMPPTAFILRITQETDGVDMMPF